MASDDFEAFYLAQYGRLAGVLRRRGRRRTVGIATAALATVLAAAVVGVAVRDRADRDQVVVDPSAGSIPLPLVSDLGPIVGAQLLDATAGWSLTGDRLAWTDTGGRSWRTITPAGASGLDLLTAFFLDRRTGWSPPTSRTTAARSS